MWSYDDVCNDMMHVCGPMMMCNDMMHVCGTNDDVCNDMMHVCGPMMMCAVPRAKQ